MVVYAKLVREFAYRIEINWWVFAIAGLAAICIALLTVSFQAIKAGLANPVKVYVQNDIESLIRYGRISKTRVMFKNYLKIAWRNLVKNKMYSLINLTGLTIGMTCFILIALFIQFELSFDKQNKKSDRTFRVVQQQVGNNYRGTDMFALAPLPLGVALKEDFPEVEAVTNINQRFALLVNENESFSERGILTDKNIFDVFTIPILEGNAKDALEDPSSILLTESLAKKYSVRLRP